MKIMNPFAYIAKKQKNKALQVCLANLEEEPGKPDNHFALLVALAVVDKVDIPTELPEKLLEYYISVSNFPMALGTLLFSVKAGVEHSQSTISSFLDKFSLDSQSPSSKPPERSRKNSLDLEFSDETTSSLAKKAVQLWQDKIDKIFLPPPVQGHAVPLFKAMGKNSLVQLLKMGEIQYYQPKQRIIKQGAEENCFYILVQGVLKVTRDTEQGHVKLGFLRQGSFFGEMALVTSAPRSANVLADTSAIVLKISWELLEKMLEIDPELADELATYTRIRLLKNLVVTSPLFRTISTEAKNAVITSFKPVIKNHGEIIIQEGEKAKGLYLLASGEVSVYSEEQGEQTLLSTLLPGEVFGEISLIREGDATATVSVSSDEGAVLMHLSRDSFQKIAVLYPEVLSHVYQVSLERSQETAKVRKDESIPAEDYML
ncbi:MAG: cyclic nucleotide-binding domain-containing protein [Myxococcota bacterium]